MLQTYTTISPGPGQSVTLKGNKGIFTLLALISLTFAVYTAYITGAVSWTKRIDTTLPLSPPQTSPTANEVPPVT